MDIGKIERIGDREIPGIPKFDPAKAPAVRPTTPTPAPAPTPQREKEKLPA